MDTASGTLLESVEDKPPLEQLANSLMHLIAINPHVRISVNEHDHSVSIILKLRNKKGIMIGRCEVFRIYDPAESVADRNVADNRVWIVDGIKHPKYYMQIRDFLEGKGYDHFHNSFEDYTRKRWIEYQGL